MPVFASTSATARRVHDANVVGLLCCGCERSSDAAASPPAGDTPRWTDSAAPPPLAGDATMLDRWRGPFSPARPPHLPSLTMHRACRGGAHSPCERTLTVTGDEFRLTDQSGLITARRRASLSLAPSRPPSPPRRRASAAVARPWTWPSVADIRCVHKSHNASGRT